MGATLFAAKCMTNQIFNPPPPPQISQFKQRAVFACHSHRTFQARFLCATQSIWENSVMTFPFNVFPIGHTHIITA